MHQQRKGQRCTSTVLSSVLWLHEAIARIEADYQRSADTHLIPLPCPPSRTRTASTCTSRTNPPTPRAASSTGWRARCSSTRCATAGSGGLDHRRGVSGSTAVSEAYFAQAAGPAVRRRDAAQHLAREDRADRAFHGGRCHFVDSAAAQVYAEARGLAAQTGGHYMDQFTYAERATDWRGNNNIAESMFTRWRASGTRCRAGSWWARAPAAPAPPSAAMCATSATPRRCAWPTRRARCSAPTTARATPR
jgi:cysteine synthase A